MPKKRTYTSAKSKLDQIVSELEGESISIDELSKKVTEAKKLIEWCKTKLRSTKEELLDKDQD